MQLRISFDFDCTLGEDIIKKLATLLFTGSQIFIITSRCKGMQTSNRDLYSVAKKIGIKDENIHFTEGDWKWKRIKDLNIDIHFDDVAEECELIKLNTNCQPILIWDEYSKESIKHESFGKGIF